MSCKLGLTGMSAGQDQLIIGIPRHISVTTGCLSSRCLSGLLRRSKTGVLVNKKPDYTFKITYHFRTLMKHAGIHMIQPSKIELFYANKV